MAVAFGAEGAATVTVNCCDAGVVPVALIISGLGVQVTPGGSAEQEMLALVVPVEPAAGVKVIVEVPLLPAVTAVAVPLMLNVPLLELDEKVRLKTDCPPRAMGLGSAGPKELTMMKYVVPPVTEMPVNCDCVTIPGLMSSLQALGTAVKLPEEPVQIESTLS